MIILIVVLLARGPLSLTALLAKGRRAPMAIEQHHPAGASGRGSPRQTALSSLQKGLRRNVVIIIENATWVIVLDKQHYVLLTLSSVQELLGNFFIKRVPYQATLSAKANLLANCLLLTILILIYFSTNSHKAMGCT